MIKKIKSSITFLAVFILLTGCSSPLEDLEINDFNLIRANISVIKEVHSRGEVEDLIELQITDKNWKGFELRGGTVKVNDSEMKYQNKVLINAYYSNIEILPNKEYVFEIRLANGATATSKITTPAIDISSIAYDKEISLGKDFTVSWEDASDPTHVKFYLDDNSFGENPSYSFTNTIESQQGKFVIPGNQTKNYPHANRRYFNLVFKGRVNNSPLFRSSISTVEVIYKAKNIKVLP